MTQTLEDKLAKIKHEDGLILKQLKRWIEHAGGTLLPSDIFLVGVAKRTLALSEGFRTHIAARNFTCAAALLRLQVDTALRVYAACLVPNSERYAEAVFNGDEVHRMKNREGKRLTDSYLAKELSKHHPWVEDVYRDTCNFIHFTSRHIFTSVAKINNEKGMVWLWVSAKDPPRAESDYFEVVDAFLQSMKLTVALAHGWQLVKKRAKLRVR